MPGRGESFPSIDLSGIRPGEFTLGVPTFRDIIQINQIHYGDDIGRTRLALLREGNTLIVEREDNRPIRIWINGYSFEEEDERRMQAGGGSVEVFREPVHSFTFVNPMANYWHVAGEGVEYEHVARIKVLAEIIGVEGVAKQARMARQSDNRQGFGV